MQSDVQIKGVDVYDIAYRQEYIQEYYLPLDGLRFNLARGTGAFEISYHDCNLAAHGIQTESRRRQNKNQNYYPEGFVTVRGIGSHDPHNFTDADGNKQPNLLVLVSQQ